MGVNDIKTSLQIKTEGWLSIGKNIINHWKIKPFLK